MPVAMKLAVISLVFCCHVAGQHGLGVDYAKDDSYGYVPPKLVPTLHSLEQKTEKKISVTCCDKKRAVSKGQCGKGIKCEGICENETDYAIIITSNSTKNWCDITSDIPSGTATSHGSHGIFNIPLNFINWCTWSVTHSSQISTYPVCCLHPYVYNNVEGVAGTTGVCCAEFGLCF
eukprot:GFUD01088024.1.p1 GENE.GFUD01088024.1~~GFUD01088024.1.p1  ORF type:complete len:176 (+),score=22.87 GFUD01088024.1:46-573(+)